MYRRINEYYVRPRKTGSDGEIHYSILLYGPPGTGKSWMTEELAKALGYAYLPLSPSDFVAGGPGQVEARATAIFAALQEQRQTVILLDELDRLLLDRDAPLYSRQEDIFQFMTPGMLTKLKELRDVEGPVFVIATNYVERIDRAAQRFGRIDDRLLILPPDLDSRIQKLDTFLEGERRAGVVDSDDIIAFARATALYTHTELMYLVQRGREAATSGNLKDALATAAKDQPNVGVASYQTRFRKGVEALTGERVNPSDFPTVQEPFEEFLFMAWLWLQVDTNTIADGHRGWISDVIDEARDRIPDDAESYRASLETMLS